MDLGAVNLLSINTDRSNNPLELYWAGPKSACELHTFSSFPKWCDFIANLSLTRPVPQTVAHKFDRAQRLYFLAWIDSDIIKSGELAAFAALEMALRDSYPAVYQQNGRKGKKIPAYIKDGLKHMVEKDNLTDEVIPICRKSGCAVVANLYGDKKDKTGMLAAYRNSLAHGDPFNDMPYASLLEVVRDLIDYMYRDTNT